MSCQELILERKIVSLDIFICQHLANVGPMLFNPHWANIGPMEYNMNILLVNYEFLAYNS